MKVILQKGLRGLSGSMEDWVYSIRNGKTYLGPKPNRTKERSQAELDHQERFQEAVDFGKSAMVDPVLREFYEPIAQARKITIYALAVGDFLSEPEFKPLNLSKYQGQVGDPILIRAIDDLGLADVDVKIVSQEGTPIESGKAVETGVHSGKWTYTATQPVARGTDVFIEVKGVDHAGNQAQLTENPTVGMDA